MGFGRMAVELGVDARRQAVANHQQRRVAERQAVALQLPQRIFQVFAGRLVFPREGAAPENIGVTSAPANHAVFFFKQIAVFAAGLGHTKQFAQIQKVTLRTLLFIELKGRAAGTPFLDEGLWRHFFVLVTMQGVVEC